MAEQKKPPPPHAPDISILGDSVTLHPSGYTESPQHHDDHSRTLIDTMARFRESPLDFLREISLHFSATGWRGYDNVIGQPMFYTGFTEQMKARVLDSPMLRAKVTELAQKRVVVEQRDGLLAKEDNAAWKRKQALEGSLLEVSDKIVENMICKFESKRFIRGAYYLVTQLLTRAYHQGVHVSSEEILKLRAVAKKAEEKKQSIIFLPSHRSHVDYVSLQIMCYRMGLALPTVVAGDNLNFPLVGPFLQNAGAMWIRRSFGEDQLYSTLVQTYIDTLLQCGYNFECFIEGGRSRTGKLLSPKFGILRFLLDSLLSGRVEDAIVCPVSTQYDKVIEVDSYISELLGTPKKKENLQEFLSASSILNLRLGRVDVRFHEPWSLREFVNDQYLRYTDLPAQISNKDSWSHERRQRLLHTLGYRVLSDINEVSVIMPTALVGTVLLTLRGRGVGKAELIRRVEWLCDRVRSQGGRVAHFAGLDTEIVVDRALEVLGSAMVGVVPGLPEETYYAIDRYGAPDQKECLPFILTFLRFQLSFYRNMTIHLFILEALVCAGLYTKIKIGGGLENQCMTYQELRSEVYFLSQLFRGEFIFPPEGLESNLAKALNGLEADQVLQIERHPGNQDKLEHILLTNTERESGRENYDFYCFLIWPFVEAAWLGAVSLLMLTPPWGQSGDVWLDIKKVQERAQLLGKTLYHQGDLSYFEAVNTETLKNAYTRFEEEGIIIVTKPRAAKLPSTIKIADDWMPSRDPTTGHVLPQGRLWQFAESISQSRREGKNRRDGMTVSKRVLHLVQVSGEALWEVREGKAKEVKDAELEEEAKPRKPRRRTIRPAKL
jgi:1-acyl-sn-glycerol-3-phosphate acyltransferase